MPADTYGAHGPGRCAIGYRHRRRLLNCSLAVLLLSLSDRSGGARRLGTLTCELLQLISRLHSLSPCSSPPLVFFRCALRVVVGGEGNPDTAGGWSSELKRVSLASSTRRSQWVMGDGLLLTERHAAAIADLPSLPRGEHPALCGLGCGRVVSASVFSIVHEIGTLFFRK